MILVWFVMFVTFIAIFTGSLPWTIGAIALAGTVIGAKQLYGK